MNHNNIEKVKIIGLGQAGINIVSKLQSMRSDNWIEIAAVDSDKATLEKTLIEQKFLIGEEWCNGQGCGGNKDQGIKIFSHKSNKVIKDFLQQCSLLFIVAGFGRGSGSGGTPIIARMARNKNIPTVIIPIIPFVFEGHQKIDIAEESIDELIRNNNNTVIPIPNELASSFLPPETYIKEAIEMVNKDVAKAIIGLARLLHFNNLLSIDLCALHNILYQKKSRCSIGYSKSLSKDMGERIDLAINSLFKSPLLGGAKKIREADYLVVSIIGGKDITIAEAKIIMEAINKKKGDKGDILFGVSIDNKSSNSLEIVILTINIDETKNYVLPAFYFKKNIGIKKTTTNSKKLNLPNQLELPFNHHSRGIFTNTPPTLYKNEDLDIPTFQRKKVFLKK